MIPADKDRTAFPSESGLRNPGMTLRDYFAAKALAGISYEIENETRAAQWCYAMADAMLEARKK